MLTFRPMVAACACATLAIIALAQTPQPIATAQADSQQTPIGIQVTTTPRARLPIVLRARATLGPTPTPTATPAPAARCAQGQPVVLPAWFVYEPRYGGVHGIVELCNPLDRAAYVDYAFDALDARGNLIESISDSSWYPIPARGGVMCAESIFSTRPAGAARYQFRVRGWSLASGFLAYGGTLTGSTYDPAVHTVNGTIRNTTGAPLYVGMAVALYDAGGQILQCDELPTINDSSLDAGQVTSFRSRFFDFDPVEAGILQRVARHTVTLSQVP